MSVPVITGRLERVVVFGNGALITRVVDVPAGSTRVAVDGLPLRLVDDALRVRPASPGLRVGLVEERCRVQLTRTAAPANEGALLEARIRLAGLAQQRQTLQALRAFDRVDAELPPPEVATSLGLGPVLALLSDADGRAAHLTAVERALDDEEREATRALRELERQGVVDATPPKVLRGVEVAVDVGDGAGRLEVEYFVGAARWVPSYALHLHRSGAQTRARLVLGALIAQATGEDWNDVAIAVSTAPLTRASTLPVVHSWRLGRAQPARLKGYRPLPSDLPTLFSGWDRFPTAPSSSSPPRPRPMPPPPPPQNLPPSAPMPMSPKADLGGMPMPVMAAAPPAAMRSRAAPAEMSKRRAMPRDEEEAFAELDDEGGAELERSMDAMPRRAGGPGGGGGSGSAPAVVDELPPTLRTTGMRMAFADEGARRGLLLPMDLRERLTWLLDVADVAPVAEPGSDDGDAAVMQRHELQRALDGLEEAEARLHGRPLPPGTRSVSGARARVFGGAGRATIASDGFEHRVEVHREEGPSTIVHHAVPREALDVWRVCRFSPSGALPAGPVQVFEDDAFVVAGHVEGSAGAAMAFNLGVDPDVRIEARTPHIHQSEKGLMGGTSHVEHKVVTEVRSTRPDPVKLTLFDRLPVPDEQLGKDLQVSLVSSAPPLERTERGPDGASLEGGVAVTVTLMPGDKLKLEHVWTLTLPAKLDVVGGTRRE